MNHDVGPRNIANAANEVANDINVGDFTLIRPQDDVPAVQASDRADELVQHFFLNGHSKVKDVDLASPADQSHITSAIGSTPDLIFYFGHGDKDNWLTNSGSTVSASNIGGAKGKAVVSVACKTGCNLGPDAITAGIKSWLGFTISVPVIASYSNLDPIGEAIVKGINCLASKGTMQQARNDVEGNLDQVVVDYDKGGRFNGHPQARFGYFAALALRDHVVLHGNSGFQPLP